MQTYLHKSKITITNRSHVHQERILKDIEEHLTDVPRSGLVIRTFEIGRTEPCYIRGPSVGTDPVPESEVYYAARPPRSYMSRMVEGEPTKTNLVTVIVYGGVLATCFYGPLAAREVNDPNLSDMDRAESIAFWSQHALIEEVDL